MRKFNLILVPLLSASVAAEPIPVPNYSFELPTVSRNDQNPFGALPFIGDWDENTVGLGDEFNQNTGVFLNTDAGEPDHINNAEQRQLVFLSTLIGNAMRLELSNTYVPDHTYSLTVGVAKSLTFPAGDTEQLEIALFYFSGNVEQIVASAFVTGSQVTSTSLFDVTMTSPVISPTDAWAGKKIGILVRPSITDPDDEEGEGFWDVDNVRLDDALSTLTLADAAILVHCLTGPAADSPSSDCSPEQFDRLDLNADSHIDLLDFAEFQTLFETP